MPDMDCEGQLFDCIHVLTPDPLFGSIPTKVWRKKICMCPKRNKGRQEYLYSLFFSLVCVYQVVGWKRNARSFCMCVCVCVCACVCVCMRVWDYLNQQQAGIGGILIEMLFGSIH